MKEALYIVETLSVEKLEHGGFRVQTLNVASQPEAFVRHTEKGPWYGSHKNIEKGPDRETLDEAARIFDKLGLQPQQVREYVAGDGSVCPKCKSDDIEGEVTEHDICPTQVIECNACGFRWRDVYSLSGIDATD